MSSMSGMSEFERGRSMNYYCGLSEKRFTSWTYANPGRRFDVCRKNNDRCRFWERFDEEDTPQKQKLTAGLLKRILKMKKEIVAFRTKERKLMVFLVVSWMLLVAVMIKGK